MKYTLRIPTKEQYAYIEAEFEAEGDTGGELAIGVYRQLTSMVQGGQGVGIKKLAAIIHEYCTTGNIADGGGYDFSSNESLLLNELKKLVRRNQ